MISSLVGEAIPVLQQAREIGITQPIVGRKRVQQPGRAQEREVRGGRAHRGKRVVHRQHRAEEQGVRCRFPQGCTARIPDQFAAQAYDGMYILATAIRNAGSADRPAIRDALAAIRGQEGALGNFSFDENRDPVHPSVTLTVKDGRFVLFQ